VEDGCLDTTIHRIGGARASRMNVLELVWELN
jgi:hypothetical protein